MTYEEKLQKVIDTLKQSEDMCRAVRTWSDMDLAMFIGSALDTDAVPKKWADQVRKAIL